jgi:hypothetical protein
MRRVYGARCLKCALVVCVPPEMRGLDIGLVMVEHVRKAHAELFERPGERTQRDMMQRVGMRRN